MNIIIFGVIFFFTGLVGMGIWFITKLSKRATYIADILEERADGRTVILAGGVGIKVIKKPGEIEKWKIVGSKIEPFQPIGREMLIPYLKKGVDKVYLLRDKDGFFHAMALDIDQDQERILLKANYREQMDWIVRQYDERSKIKEKRSKWSEYTPIIAILLAVMVVITTTIFSFQYAGQQLSRAQDVLSQIDAKQKQFEERFNINALEQAQAIIQQNKIVTQTQNWTQTTVAIS